MQISFKVHFYLNAYAGEDHIHNEYLKVGLKQLQKPLTEMFNVRDHLSQPYSTTGNVIVLYILIFKFLESSLEDKTWLL